MVLAHPAGVVGAHEDPRLPTLGPRLAVSGLGCASTCFAGWSKPNMTHNPRVLKARDIERLENTSFASVSLGAAVPNIEATTHLDQHMASGFACSIASACIDISEGGNSCVACSVNDSC